MSQIISCGEKESVIKQVFISFLFIGRNRIKVINYSMSEGEEMNILVHNGKCQFVDNLYAWAKSFHNGRKFFANIALGATRF